MKSRLSKWLKRAGRAVKSAFTGEAKGRKLKERFEEIYAKNEWTHGSGIGSLPANTREYVALLEKFLVERNIRSVVDMGCGDWQFSKKIHWGSARYRGFDVVAPVIKRNRRKHAADGISFHLYSGNPADLPAADLLIVKDVLQHLSNKNVRAFLPHLSRFKYALITNCYNPKGPTENNDIKDGDFRYLDLRLPPFNLKAEEICDYTHKINLEKNPDAKPWWRKRVLLVERS